MLTYFVAIPLFVYSVLGYAAQAVYEYPMAEPSNVPLIGTVQTVEEPRATVAAADASAEAFAERISTLGQLTATSSLSTTDAVIFRTIIADRFHEAFTAISQLEASGHFAEAESAREIMQVAIDIHMQTTHERTPDITRDLATFSKFMTETLIQRSINATT